MIHSMTAFSSARNESELGELIVEIRTVNSRFLDIHLRLPDELRSIEGALREQLGQYIKRGKVDIRMNYMQAIQDAPASLNVQHLAHLSGQLDIARSYMPDIAAPQLLDLLNAQSKSANIAFDPEAWMPLCLQTTQQALTQLQEARRREGQRLADMMLNTAAEMRQILDQTEQRLPEILQNHQEKITARLQDTLLAVSPQGFEQISGTELSARIAQEASLFSLRSDVAEELARLRSHLQELDYLLETATEAPKQKGSTGKRLDFLCQEMNREANTLGSKAAGLDITRSAIDLKLLIEQIREQAQNIE